MLIRQQFITISSYLHLHLPSFPSIFIITAPIGVVRVSIASSRRQGEYYLFISLTTSLLSSVIYFNNLPVIVELRLFDHRLRRIQISLYVLEKILLLTSSLDKIFVLTYETGESSFGLFNGPDMRVICRLSVPSLSTIQSFNILTLQTTPAT